MRSHSIRIPTPSSTYQLRIWRMPPSPTDCLKRQVGRGLQRGERRPRHGSNDKRPVYLYSGKPGTPEGRYRRYPQRIRSVNCLELTSASAILGSLLFNLLASHQRMRPPNLPIYHKSRKWQVPWTFNRCFARTDAEYTNMSKPRAPAQSWSQSWCQ